MEIKNEKHVLQWHKALIKFHKRQLVGSTIVNCKLIICDITKVAHDLKSLIFIEYNVFYFYFWLVNYYVIVTY